MKRSAFRCVHNGDRTERPLPVSPGAGRGHACEALYYSSKQTTGRAGRRVLDRGQDFFHPADKLGVLPGLITQYFDRCGLACFFNTLSNSFLGDRVELELLESDEMFGKEVNVQRDRPSGGSEQASVISELRHVRQVAAVISVGFAAINRRNSSFRERFARAMRCPDRTPDVLTDVRICEPVISLQENLCAGDVFCSVFTFRDELFEFIAVFF